MSQDLIASDKLKWDFPNILNMSEFAVWER